MKRFFLIPLMAFFSCVMAYATVRTAGTYDELKAAIDGAQNGDEIQLTADIAYPSGSPACINIMTSLTIDGQGHTLSGAGIRTGSTKSTLAINQGAPGNGNWIDEVVLKNITMTNSVKNGQVLNVRCNLTTLTIENANIVATSSGNNQPITFGGNQSTNVEVTINNSTIDANTSGYPVVAFNPIHLVTNNSTYRGYCGLYFRGVDNSAGSRGSVVDAEACNFDCPNVHSGKSNAFSCFPLEDDGITINLHNCGMNIEQVGDQNQALVTVNNNSRGRKELPVYITISGDNSHFNTKGGMNKTIQNLWIQGYNQNNQLVIVQEEFPEIVFVITGGTYSVNPTEDMLYYGSWVKDEETGEYTGNIHIWGPTIPDEYEVKEITLEGVATPLYRVVKKAQEKEAGVMYDLNDFVPVEGEDYGNNPVSSFDLSTGTDMTLNQETTTAGYVQVKDNADTSDPTTVTVGTPTEDQTLIINNGLDVQGESQVIVEAGSTLQIGEGGINTEKPANIVITANENGAASLIMDPTITVNQTPNLTVKMKAKQIGWATIAGDKHYFWHRFALPIQECTTWGKYPNKSTYVYGWNYTTNDWEQYGALTQMVPFQGYTLSADYEDLGDVEYTFTGQLAGNTNNALEFQRNGYNFFGNSYTGYISILALVDQLTGDNKIDGSVWVWNSESQAYFGVPLKGLRDNPEAYEDWQKEIAPMQTFILKQNGSENATTELNYASAVWGNPRYNNVAAPAPRRAEADETTRMRIVVTAQNGKSDFVMFTEDGKFTDEYENGYDASKYMNEGTLNLFATVNGENYTAVATDNLEGKTLTLNTNDEIAYTISFKKVNGEEYALRDNLTGAVIAIEEGATYEFAAQPNSTVEGRFEIVAAAKMPTAIENTEVKANAKGIYTLTGQYLGEDFEAVPAGVYVVNGVKIVK